jgi:ATP-dependent exoDNAse (exonuclease V) beta subunit
MIINQFPYKPLERVTYPNGTRHYICPETGEKLPSVTTILDATGPEKKELIEWKNRVGNEEANRIKNEALGLGTLMHTHLEKYLAEEERPGGNNTVRVQAKKMADKIIEHGLINVSKVFGIEVALYVSGLYAGTTDVVCQYRGEMAIGDFKSAKKIRKKEQITDYMLQLCAYIIAHNNLFNTDIKTGVIFMASRDYEFREFVLEKQDFNKYSDMWFERLETFFN